MFRLVGKGGFEIKDSKSGSFIAHSGNRLVERWSSILEVPHTLLILGHFFFLILFLALVLARTPIIRSLSFPCESLIEQAVTLPCHKIFFHLRTQKNLLWTQRILTRCPLSSSPRNCLKEESLRREERKGWLHTLKAQGSCRQVLFNSTGWSHETFCFVPSGAVEAAEWRFITTVVQSSPTGLAPGGAMFFRTAFQHSYMSWDAWKFQFWNNQMFLSGKK